MVNLSDVNRIGASLKQKINEMRHSYDIRIDELYEVILSMKIDG
jgi:hypothetical protein